MKKQFRTVAAAAIVLVCFAASFALAARPSSADAQAAREIAQYEKRARTTSSGLKYVVLREGKAGKPHKGQRVDTHYVGRFMDGRIFDQSIGRSPFSFEVGKGQVIKAWDEALLDMKLGEKRALIVPPSLGYGSRGAGTTIPPNAKLYFEIERLR